MIGYRYDAGRAMYELGELFRCRGEPGGGGAVVRLSARPRYRRVARSSAAAAAPGTGSRMRARGWTQRWARRPSHWTKHGCCRRWSRSRSPRAIPRGCSVANDRLSRDRRAVDAARRNREVAIDAGAAAAGRWATPRRRRTAAFRLATRLWLDRRAGAVRGRACPAPACPRARDDLGDEHEACLDASVGSRWCSPGWERAPAAAEAATALGGAGRSRA